VAPAGEEGPTFSAPARPIDELLDEHSMGTVDLIKMDIEGGEGFALRGLRRSLASGRVRRVLLELHPRELSAHGESIETAVRPLREAGLEPWTVDHSPTAYRMALAPGADPAGLLSRWDATTPLAAWPHLLWVPPKERPLP
jgi:hypothetical protein